MKLLFVLTSLSALMLAAPPAHADDGSGAQPAAEPAAAASPLTAARAHIKAQRWRAALDELRRVDARADADWNNLMGYALRKNSPPDLDGAQRHYDAALRIDPKHQGALEYAGELALMKRDLATAEAHLATLTRLCQSPCEALAELRQAVSRYRAENRP